MKTHSPTALRGIGRLESQGGPSVRFAKSNLIESHVLSVAKWGFTAWLPSIAVRTHETARHHLFPTSSLGSGHNQADGAPPRAAPLPRQVGSPAAYFAGMVVGRTGSHSLPRSRRDVTVRSKTPGAWNVAIFCADNATGDLAAQQIAAALAAHGLHVRCHLRQWHFELLSELSVFESAVDHAIEADLVIVASPADAVMPAALQAVLTEWLLHSGAEASPLTLAPSRDSLRKPFPHACNRRLGALVHQVRLPFYRDLCDAVVVAWDVWEWKHLPWEAAARATAEVTEWDSTHSRGSALPDNVRKPVSRRRGSDARRHACAALPRASLNTGTDHSCSTEP